MSETVPKSEEMTPIDLRFRDEVFYPWEEASHASQYPWEATPALRKNWKALLAPNERLDREDRLSRLEPLFEINRRRKRGDRHFLG